MKGLPDGSRAADHEETKKGASHRRTHTEKPESTGHDGSDGSASRKTGTTSSPQFTKLSINHAVYGTGWPDDDNVVIAAKATGTWQVLSKVIP